jgi:hypothetical protein
MKKLQSVQVLSLGAMVAALGISIGGWGLIAPPVAAGTCASNCGVRPIRYKTGQLIKVEVVNFTSGLLLLEDVQASDPIPVAPSRTFRLTRRSATEAPNGSVVFWDSQGLPLEATIKQPKADVLRIEIRPSYYPPGSRSVYLRDDGTVAVL